MYTTIFEDKRLTRKTEKAKLIARWGRNATGLGGDRRAAWILLIICLFNPPVFCLFEMIVIADDNREDATILQHILSEAAYHVLVAYNGKEALWLAQQYLPKIILLDVLMPNMNGFEVCRCLKVNTRTRAIPVIFLTALDDLENKIRGFNVGGVDYIAKPFLSEEVLIRVRTHIVLEQYHRYLEYIIQQRTEQFLKEIREYRRLERQYDILSDIFLHNLEFFIRHYWVCPPGLGLKEKLAHYEQQCIRQTLIRYDGKVSIAAEKLQVSERVLYRRMQKYKLSSKPLTYLSAENVSSKESS